MEGIKNYGQPPLDINVDLMMLYGAKITKLRNPENGEVYDAIIVPIEGSGLVTSSANHCFLNLRATYFKKFNKDYIIKQILPKETYKKLHKEKRLNEIPIIGNVTVRYPNISPLPDVKPTEIVTEIK